MEGRRGGKKWIHLSYVVDYLTTHCRLQRVGWQKVNEYVMDWEGRGVIAGTTLAFACGVWKTHEELPEHTVSRPIFEPGTARVEDRNVSCSTEKGLTRNRNSKQSSESVLSYCIHLAVPQDYYYYHHHHYFIVCLFVCLSFVCASVLICIFSSAFL
jgi:hypothetical protein